MPAAPAQPAAALHDARMAHLWGAIGALLGCGMFGWIGPLVYLNGSAKRSAYVRQHAVAALNVQLLGVVGQLVSIVLSFLGIGVVIFVALWIYTIVWGFVAASQAGAGKEAKYPVTLQFVH